MTWTIRTDRDFDRALRKLDRQVAVRVLKALAALENLETRQHDERPCRGPTHAYGGSEWATIA